jgi:hypothetical protein
VRGQVASMASGRPLSPSHTTMQTPRGERGALRLSADIGALASAMVRIAELRCTPICWQARSPEVRHSVDIVATVADTAD